MPSAASALGSPPIIPRDDGRARASRVEPGNESSMMEDRWMDAMSSHQIVSLTPSAGEVVGRVCVGKCDDDTEKLSLKWWL